MLASRFRHIRASHSALAITAALACVSGAVIAQTPAADGSAP